MLKIGLLSDTHGNLDSGVSKFLANSDQIWHAGDIGHFDVIEKLREIAPVIAVYGNIDGTDLRISFPEIQVFKAENIKVIMKHIGGYPGRYERGMLPILQQEKPRVFISGHSHILKVIHDKKLDILHLNPGACGNSGLHQVKTAIRFEIDQEKISNLEIIEIPRK